MSSKQKPSSSIVSKGTQYVNQSETREKAREVCSENYFARWRNRFVDGHFYLQNPVSVFSGNVFRICPIFLIHEIHSKWFKTYLKKCCLFFILDLIDKIMTPLN